jgi:tRNA U34 5-carboxymethylaminomethyl modifying GTPase MnmE/TrmE
MTIELEKKLLTNDLEKTPAVILEQLFSYIENHRIKTEEGLSRFNKEIERLKGHIEEFNNELLTATKKEMKILKQAIQDRQESIKNVQKRRRTVFVNLDILWLNQLRIGRILGYELED